MNTIRLGIYFCIIFSFIVLVPNVQDAYGFFVSGSAYMEDRDGNTDRTPNGISACVFDVNNPSQPMRLPNNNFACNNIEDGRYSIDAIRSSTYPVSIKIMYVTQGDSNFVTPDSSCRVGSCSVVEFDSTLRTTVNQSTDSRFFSAFNKPIISPTDLQEKASFWIASDIGKGWKYLVNQFNDYSPSTVKVIYPFELRDETTYLNTMPSYLQNEITLNTIRSNSGIGDASYQRLVLHEYSHHVMYDIYGADDYNRIQACQLVSSNGQDVGHYFPLTNTVGCAWSEGFAHMLPHAIMNQEEFHEDGQRGDREFNIEKPSTWVWKTNLFGQLYWDELDGSIRHESNFHQGGMVEGRVGATLHDIWDGERDGEDARHGFGRILSTLTDPNDNSPPITIFDFYNDWTDTHPTKNINGAFQTNTIDTPFIPQQTTTPTSSNIESNTVTVSWTVPSSIEAIQEYEVFRYASPKVSIANVTASTLSYTDGTVLPSTTYQYTISAKNQFGNGIESDPLTVITLDADNTAPIITLNTPIIQSINHNDQYLELGASCIDNIDGDISSSIVTNSSNVNTGIVGSYQVTYDCTDLDNNEAIQKIRTVNVLDISAPEIYLTGDNPQSIIQYAPYNELGATCTDDVDGDISLNIIIDSTTNLNTEILGSHQVTYDCTDSSDNSATQEVRTVNVIETQMPPILDNIPHEEILEGNSKNIDISATPTNGDSVTLSVNNAPSWVSIIDHNNSTGTLFIDVPFEVPNTSYNATVRASDNDGYDEKTFTINIIESPIPTLEVIINTDSTDDTSFTFGLKDFHNSIPISHFDIDVTNNNGTTGKIPLLQSHNSDRLLNKELQQGTVNPSYDFVDMNCTVNGVSDLIWQRLNDPDTRASFAIFNNQNVICTYNYERNSYIPPTTITPPTLEVIVNTNGGIDSSLAFHLNDGTGVFFVDTVNNTNTGTSGKLELTDGVQYILQQNDPPAFGYEFVNFDCTVNGESVNYQTTTPTRASFWANNNEDIVCTFNNAYTAPISTEPPTLQVRINTDGGNDVFTFGLKDFTDYPFTLFDINVVDNTGITAPMQLHDGHLFELQQSSINPSYEMVDYVCSVNGVDTYFPDGRAPYTRANFTPHIGEEIICTYNNTFTP